MGFEGLRTRIAKLAEAADALKQHSGCESVPFSLAYFSGSDRGPAPELVARAGAGRSLAIVWRDYEAVERPGRAKGLAALCREKGVKLVVAGDVNLAQNIGADGAHMPAWASARRRAMAKPGFFVTAACHSERELRLAADANADAAFLSPVFATRSHPGAAPLGPLRFRRIAAQAPLPVFALGGVDETRAADLAGSNVVGFGAIDAFAAKRPD
ncbi:MAG: thiamine phosphate synthase [Pseudomonadota bacterium]